MERPHRSHVRTETEAKGASSVPALSYLDFPSPGTRYIRHMPSGDASLGAAIADPPWNRDKLSLPSPANTADL